MTSERKLNKKQREEATKKAKREVEGRYIKKVKRESKGKGEERKRNEKIKLQSGGREYSDRVERESDFRNQREKVGWKIGEKSRLKSEERK